MATFDNRSDIIDSRDVIARIEELEGYIEDAEIEAKEAAERARIEYQDQFESTDDYDEEDLVQAMDDAAMLHEPDELDVEELRVLKELAEEASGYAPDWTYGEALIRDSYFKEYAQGLAEDIGAIDPRKTRGWPLDHIDWDAAAEALKYDYTRVDYGGVDYWIRS